MVCEDCGNRRAKGPGARVRMTVVASSHPFAEHEGETIERVCCESCLRFRETLSYLKVEILERPAPKLVTSSSQSAASS